MIRCDFMEVVDKTFFQKELALKTWGMAFLL